MNAMTERSAMADDLTEADLERITNTSQIAAQKRVLDKAGIFYIEQVGGTITTTWYHVHHPRNDVIASGTPNWGAARRRAR